jgi:hypothetical protein
MSVFEDEEAYTRFKNRTLKTQRNKVGRTTLLNALLWSRH